jgi:hypothetical protein
MFNGAKKAAVDCVISAMRTRPNDFEIGTVTMTDTKTKYRYWISQGFIFYGMDEPFKLWFGFIHGFRFSMALKGLKAHQLISKTCGRKANATA